MKSSSLRSCVPTLAGNRMGTVKVFEDRLSAPVVQLKERAATALGVFGWS